MKTAAQIAQEIQEAAQAFMDESKTYEEHSELNQKLWNTARALGIEEEVDALLQKASEKEFREALEAPGISF